jgi:hypothetical protein
LHELTRKDQLLQCDDVFFQRIHFADEHRDKIHDGRCRFAERSSIFYTLHPNLFKRLESFYQTTIQQGFETLETFGILQICALRDKSM